MRNQNNKRWDDYDLTDFGNFLLKKYGLDKNVYHADFFNWLELRDKEELKPLKRLWKIEELENFSRWMKEKNI